MLHNFSKLLVLQSAKERTQFLGDVNDALLSGEAKLGDDGVAAFGDMDANMVQKVKDQIKKFAPNAQAAEELEKSITTVFFIGP